MEKLIFDKEGEFAINFTWKDENISCINFKAVEVVSDYIGEEDSPTFVTFNTDKGGDSNCLEFKDVKEEYLFFTGFIKWDGCMEIHNLNHHFCYRNTILQRVVDLIYDSAKEILGNKVYFD